MAVILLSVNSSLACKKSILHQRADGHRAYSAGHGCYIGAKRSHVFKVDITARAESALARSIGNTRSAHIDYHGSGLTMSAVTNPRAAEGGDYNVGLAAYILQVLGCAVTHRNGGIAGLCFCIMSMATGFAHDIASSEYYTTFALSGYVVTCEQLKNTGREWLKRNKEVLSTFFQRLSGGIRRHPCDSLSLRLSSARRCDAATAAAR